MAVVDEPLPYSAAGRHSPWLIAVAVSIATFMEVLDTTIANVALRHIAGSLAASQDQSTYVITSYLVSNAVIVPMAGWLATVLGRKRFYLLCVGTFTLSSVMCATATSLWQIVVWRILQGLGGGGMAPVEQSIFADSFPLRQRPQAFALYGLTIVLAPAIGPIIGGWLTDSYSWRWVFLINLPVGLLSFALVSWLVVDSPALKADRAAKIAAGFNVDFVGFALVVLGFGALQLVLDRFEREDGFSSPFIIACTAVTVICLSSLLVWEYFHPQPVMNVRLWRNGGFAVACALMFCVGFVLIASTQLLPQLAQSLMGYDAVTAGLTLGLAGLVTILVMPLSGMLTGRVLQPRVLSACAFAMTAYAMWYATQLSLQANFAALSYARMLQAIAIPFLFIPISSAALVGIRPQDNGDASALTNLMRQLGGSVGVSVTTTELAWRSQFHQSRLVEHVTAYGPLHSNASLPAVMARVAAQAGMLTYVDLFAILAGVSAVAAVLALALPLLPKGVGAAAH